MTTFWIGAGGVFIGATSEPDAEPPGAVDSTETPPDSPKHQTWSGVAWVDNPDRATQEQLATDLAVLRVAGKDIAVVLTEIADWLLANTAMTADDFTPTVKRSYLDLKAVANRVK